MPASNLGAAKRAFVKVLLSLAVSYAAALEVNRDSADSDVMRAYILSQKTKPGDTEQKLHWGVTKVLTKSAVLELPPFPP